MELSALQQQISSIFLSNAKRDGIEITDEYLFLKLSEEVGEAIQSFIVHKKQCRPTKYTSEEESHRELAKELADVAGLLFIIASRMDIDLEEAIDKKWVSKEWLGK